VIYISRAEYQREYRKKKKESQNLMCMLKIFLDDDRQFAIRFKPMTTSKALEIKSLLEDDDRHVDILLL